MPIYDYDGTANNEIGRVYDNDGTANHQIGKVYDNDGTANSLIYSADGNVFPDMAWTGGGANDGTVTTSSLQVILPEGSSKTNSSCRTASKVDLTNYSKLTFVVSQFNKGSGSGTPQFSLGIDSDTTTHAHDSFYKYVKVTKTGTYTLDVSGVSGSYYVAIAVWCSSVHNHGFTVTSITAE